MGCNPAVLGGAIISGGLFGDNIAPVSDTTIVSTTGQTYTKKSGCAEIGGAVKDRSKYVIIAFILSVILFAIFGGAKPVRDWIHQLQQHYWLKTRIQKVF